MRNLFKGVRNAELLMVFHLQRYGESYSILLFSRNHFKRRIRSIIKSEIQFGLHIYIVNNFKIAI